MFHKVNYNKNEKLTVEIIATLFFYLSIISLKLNIYMKLNREKHQQKIAYKKTSEEAFFIMYQSFTLSR